MSSEISELRELSRMRGVEVGSGIAGFFPGSHLSIFCDDLRYCWSFY